MNIIIKFMYRSWENIEILKVEYRYIKGSRFARADGDGRFIDNSNSAAKIRGIARKMLE